MGLADQPDTLARLLAEIERRLRTLETATRAAKTSISDDAGNELVRLDREGIKIYDDAGVLRARFGYLSATSGYGAAVRDAANGLRFEVNDNGYRDPWLSHPWRNVITPDRASTTSAAFVDLWGGRVELITHQGVVATSAWVTDAGTTGEVRLRQGASVTSAVPLAAASSGAQQFRWLHGAALGGGPLDFHLQVRRTGGAGSVHLDQPFGGLEMADPGSCTATGL